MHLESLLGNCGDARCYSYFLFVVRLCRTLLSASEALFDMEFICLFFRSSFVLRRMARIREIQLEIKPTRASCLWVLPTHHGANPARPLLLLSSSTGAGRLRSRKSRVSGASFWITVVGLFLASEPPTKWDLL
jgi:hypothetical protein